MSVNVLYKTQAKATGGRDGHAATLDGTLDVKLTTPKELSASPDARPDAIGMTWRRIRNTSDAISNMFNASTVRMAEPRAAVCAA